jgi:hypothetical protein
MNHFRRTLLIRIAPVALILFAFAPGAALGFDLGLGLGAVDSGDNRLVRSATVSAGGPSFATDLTYYGTKNSLFKVQDFVLSGVLRWNTGIGGLEFVAGLAVLTEVITYDPGSDPTKGTDKTAYLPATGPKAPTTRQRRIYYNGAAVLGLRYRQPLFGNLWSELSWTSLIFPAGMQTLLITTDMKDVWAFSVGVSL